MAVDLSKLSMPSDQSAISIGQLARQLPTQPGAALPRQQIQEAAAQVTKQETAQRVEQGKQLLQDEAFKTGQDLARQEMQQEQRRANAAIALQQKQRETEQRLQSLDKVLYDKTYNETMQFRKDEIDRIEWNQKQLGDYALMNAKSEEDLTNYRETINQAANKAERLYQHAIQLMQQEAEQSLSRYQQRLKQTSRMELSQMEARANEQMLRKEHDQSVRLTQAAIDAKKQEAKEASDAAMTDMILAQLFGITGAAIGSFAGPGGAALVYNAGVAAGTTLSKVARS